MKSILIIDTPTNCYECPCSNEGCYLCQISRRQLEDDFQDRRPSWCPLKLLPSRWIPQVNGLSIEQQIRNIDFASGWNTCLKKITGETE